MTDRARGGFTDPLVAAMADHERERTETRTHTEHRIHVDPIAHMVATLLRRLTQMVGDDDLPGAILDATAAVMAVIDGGHTAKAPEAPVAVVTNVGGQTVIAQCPYCLNMFRPNGEHTCRATVGPLGGCEITIRYGGKTGD